METASTDLSSPSHSRGIKHVIKARSAAEPSMYVNTVAHFHHSKLPLTMILYSADLAHESLGTIHT